MSDDAAPEAEAAPVYDRARLIADVRKNDQEAIAKAYAETFQNELGRLVLAHFLVQCGVGAVRGQAETAAQLRYQTGRHDAALELALAAGFDAASVAVGVMTGDLEGTTDDATYNHAYRPGAADEF